MESAELNMKPKMFKVMRYHQEIFRGTIPQIKTFLINTGAFEGYEENIQKCRWATFKNWRWSEYELNHWCSMTKYCCISEI